MRDGSRVAQQADAFEGREGRDHAHQRGEGRVADRKQRGDDRGAGDGDGKPRGQVAQAASPGAQAEAARLARRSCPNPRRSAHRPELTTTTA